MIADPLYSKILIPNNGEIQPKELKSYKLFYIKNKMAHGVLTNARKVFGQASGQFRAFAPCCRKIPKWCEFCF
jgi:hypothetical protein